MVSTYDKYKSVVKNIFYSTVASIIVGIILSFADQLRIFSLSSNDIIAISIAILTGILLIMLIVGSMRLQATVLDQRNTIKKLKDETVWDYIVEESIRNTLTPKNRVVALSRRDVLKGEPVKFVVKSKGPVNVYLKRIYYNVKLDLLALSRFETGYGKPEGWPYALKDEYSHKQAFVEDQQFRTEAWNKSFENSILTDWFLVAELPDDLQEAEVTLQFLTLAKVAQTNKSGENIKNSPS